MPGAEKSWPEGFYYRKFAGLSRQKETLNYKLHHKMTINYLPMGKPSE